IMKTALWNKKDQSLDTVPAQVIVPNHPQRGKLFGELYIISTDRLINLDFWLNNQHGTVRCKIPVIAYRETKPHQVMAWAYFKAITDTSKAVFYPPLTTTNTSSRYYQYIKPLHEKS